MSSLILPKVYEDPFGNYPQHKGKPKISYSQYNSWISEEYVKDYIRQYFMGMEKTTNVFAEYGSACGKYFEDLTVDSKWLSWKDVKTLEKLNRPENARYEVEVVIDRGWYVIQGFIDQEYEIAPKVLTLKDLKTGNVTTKVDFYGGPDYQQTTMYSYQREVEGYTIAYSGVTLLGRKGQGRTGSPLWLSGIIEEIPTPYSLERAEKFLSKMDIITEEIAESFYLYNKVREY